MIRLKRVLVPTDFSDFSASAVQFGCELAGRFDAELHLLNVVQNPLTHYPEQRALVPMDEFELELKAVARQQLEETPEPPWNKKLVIVRYVCVGSPYLEIVRYAKTNDIDLIVIATHGRSGFSHVLVGSVAERVVRKAPCPVMTVRDPDQRFVMP